MAMERSQHVEEYSLVRVTNTYSRDEIASIIRHQLSAKDVDGIIDQPYPLAVIRSYDGCMPEFELNVSVFADHIEDKLAEDPHLSVMLLHRRATKNAERQKVLQRAIRVRRVALALCAVVDFHAVTDTQTEAGVVKSVAS